MQSTPDSCRLDGLSRQNGAPQEDLLTQLSKYLPGVIDRLTPNGQLPSQADLGVGLSKQLKEPPKQKGSKLTEGPVHSSVIERVASGAFAFARSVSEARCHRLIFEGSR